MSADESIPRRYPWPRLLAAVGLLLLTSSGLALVFGESLFRASSAVSKLQKLGAKIDFSDAWLSSDFRVLWGHLSSRKLAVTVASVECYGGLACQVRDDDLMHLRAFPELHFVGLRDQAITSAGLRHLAGLGLESLCLARTQVGSNPPGLASLSTLRKLRILDLRETHITDEELRSLSALYQLRSLDLSKTQISAAGVSHLDALFGLATLNLDQTAVTDQIMPSLARMNGLIQLGLNDTRVTGAGFDALAGHRLKELYLQRTALTDIGLRDIAQISTLAKLDISETHVTAGGLNHLSSLKNLKTLSMQGPEFGDEHLAAIASCPRLTYLRIRSDRMTAQGIQSLLPLKNLSHLEMDAARLQDPDLIRALVALPKLASIDIRRESTTDLDFEEVQHQLGPKVRLYEIYDDSSTQNPPGPTRGK